MTNRAPSTTLENPQRNSNEGDLRSRAEATVNGDGDLSLDITRHGEQESEQTIEERVKNLRERRVSQLISFFRRENNQQQSTQ